MKYKRISTFLKSDNELDDTGRLQRLLDESVVCNSIAIIDEELVVTSTIYLRGKRSVYNIEGTGFNTVINFRPSEDIPLFEIKNSKVMENSDEIIYNFEQFIEDSYIKNIRFKGNHKGCFSKFIVYRFTIFDRVYISHFNNIFVGGAFIYLSEIKNSKIEYIHENIFSNVRIIDSYIRRNYFTGNIQVDEDNRVYFPSVFSNISKISGTCIENNWIETFNTVFDRILGDTRIINNLFDYVIRIIERSENDIIFIGNIVANYSYESLEKYFKSFFNECIIRSDLVNKKYYLIYLMSGMKIMNNTFDGSTPVYYIYDEYSKNLLKDLLVSGNSYVGYSREYKLIFYTQYNNASISLNSENGRIEDVFFIKDLSDYTNNSIIEGINFSYNGIELVSEKIYTNTVSLKYKNGDFIGECKIVYYINSIIGNDRNDGFNISSAFKTIKAAILKVPAVISNSYIIKISGELEDNILNLSGISGAGTLIIQSSDINSINVDNVNIYGCNSNIIIKDISCKNITVENSGNVIIESCIINSMNINGILIRNSTATIRNTTFKCINRGITASYFSKVLSSDNNGNCQNSLVAEQCSIILKESNQPSGNIVVFSGGTVI